MVEVSIWASDGRVITAERKIEPSLGSATAQAQEVIATLGGRLFRPLSIELTLACCDQESGYPIEKPENPYRQLVEQEPLDPVAAEPMFSSSLTHPEPRLSASVIARWLDHVQQFDCGADGYVPGWSSLVVNASEVLIPPSISVAPDGLTVNFGRGHFPYPTHLVDGAYRFVAPLPGHPEANPFELSMSNQGTSLLLELSTNWSWWAESGSAGRSALLATLDDLRAAGWRVSA